MESVLLSTEYAGTGLAHRLRVADVRRLELERALREEADKRAGFGVFFATMVVLVVGYVLTVRAAVTLVPPDLDQTFVSAPVILAYAAGCAWAVRRMGLAPSDLGLTGRGAARRAGSAVAVSLLVVLAATAAKAALVAADPGFGPLFSFGALAGHDVASGAAVLVIYVAMVPLQEFVFRGAIQGTLHALLEGPRRDFHAPVLANLIFAAGHAHVDFALVIGSFSVGLLWSWMFARDRSLVGPVVSHILIGTYVLFVLA